MMGNRSFLVLFLKAFLLHSLSVLTLFTSRQRVNGFFLPQPSSLSVSPARHQILGDGPFCVTNKSLLKSSAVSASIDNVVSSGKFPETNSSSPNEDDRESYLDEESTTGSRYPWSESQQWALRDNMPKYIVRIPIKQKTSPASSANKQEDTILSSFALWRNLQNDIPELSGYPIDFLMNRYEEILNGMQDQIEISDRNDGIRKKVPPSMPGVLPFLQDYEFSAEGGICGFVTGMNGVSDGSRIETTTVKNIQESLPKGYIQTTDGHASFELGNPLQTDDQKMEKEDELEPATATKEKAAAASAEEDEKEDPKPTSV